MQVEAVLDGIVTVFGIAGILGVTASVIMFAKTAGNIKALEQSRETWENLYKAEREKSDQQARENEKLRKSIDDLSERVNRLEVERSTRQEADDEWVGRIILAMIHGGACEKRDCNDRVAPDRRHSDAGGGKATPGS